jgi:site-specific recombinase XerD
MELRKVLDAWNESMRARGLAAGTLANYNAVVGRFVEYLASQGVHTLDGVQPQHIRQWLIHRRQQGLLPSQLHNSYRMPLTFWRWCMRQRLTLNDPFEQVDAPKRQYSLKPALTPEQVQALLNACTGTDWLELRNRALILLLLDTGMRIHEACALKVEDARKECLLIRGKGGKQRKVFLSPETREALEYYLEACPFASQMTPESPLWWGLRGPVKLDALRRAIAIIGRRAGLKGHLGAHTFRRTFAVHFLRKGCDFERLRRLMGHADYAMLRHYLSLAESDLQEAHARYSPVREILGHGACQSQQEV